MSLTLNFGEWFLRTCQITTSDTPDPLGLGSFLIIEHIGPGRLVYSDRCLRIGRIQDDLHRTGEW